MNDPVSAHIASLRGQRWKNLRAKLSPAFTSGKIKAMFSAVVDCGDNLQDHLEKLCDSGELLDAREVAECYSTDDTDYAYLNNYYYRGCTRERAWKIIVGWNCSLLMSIN